MQGRSDPQRGLTDTEAFAGVVVREGSVAAWLAAHRKRLFPDEAFADLFPSRRGRPSIPGDVVATVLVLQALEGLSDTDAVEALRLRIDWKVACGLPLEHGGFHPTVLTYWRKRIAASARPRRMFDAVAEVIDATGVLAGRRRRALDSTVVQDAVATQDTVTQLVAAIRRVRREVPGAAEVELAGDYTQPGKPPCDWNDQAAREELLSRLVGDAQRLLDGLAGVTVEGAAADAVGLLGLVAGQDVEPADDDPASGRWRIARRVAKDRVVSTVDRDARHVHKTVHDRTDGFKAHVAVEPETGLITDCRMSKGNTPDGDVAVDLLARETDSVEVLADSAYGSGATRAALQDAGHTTTIKPMPLQPAVPGGFTRDEFAVDHDTRTVTCPAGITVAISAGGTAAFARRCDGCPLRVRCTASPRGRHLKIHPHDRLLVTARRDARDPAWQATYRYWRPMVERTLAWLVANGHRRVRFRGVQTNQTWLDLRAAAINLRQLVRRGLQPTDTGWAVT